MAITNKDITQKNYKKLSIQVSLNGLSFCVFDLLTNTILTTAKVDFQKHQVLEEQLWKVFVDYPVLSNSYDEIVVIHDNNLNTFVPTTLFDEKFLGSYLQYNVKVFETDLFAYDNIENYNLKNVFVPYVNINNFLLDQFSNFNYQNSNSILVDKLLGLNNNFYGKRVFVHLQSNKFEIIVTQSKELLFFNSFEYKTPEDFIYYLLFTLEQLQLNPDTIVVEFLGNINTDDEFYKIAYKYIRNCEHLNVSNLQQQFNKYASEIRQHFILYQS